MFVGINLYLYWWFTLVIAHFEHACFVCWYLCINCKTKKKRTTALWRSQSVALIFSNCCRHCKSVTNRTSITVTSNRKTFYWTRTISWNSLISDSQLLRRILILSCERNVEHDRIWLRKSWLMFLMMVWKWMCGLLVWCCSLCWPDFHRSNRCFIFYFAFVVVWFEMLLLYECDFCRVCVFLLCCSQFLLLLLLLLMMLSISCSCLWGIVSVSLNQRLNVFFNMCFTGLW